MAPIANAGANQSVNEGAAVTLNGSASTDPDGGPSPLTYSWTQTAGPAVTLTGATTAAPTFTAPTINWPTTATTLTFQLTVSDGAATNAASVNVVVNNVNATPIANAGAAQTIASGANASLNATASSDPDNGPSPLTYKWTQTAGPAVTLSSTTSATPSFTAPTGPTSLTFSLVVNDGAANSPASTVIITVNAPTTVTHGVAGDFTGDGKADPAFFNNLTGLWSIKGKGLVAFGNIGDIPTPGDYNGDKVTEPSTFTPANSLWFWKAKSWQAQGQPTVVWSSAKSGDIPVPADYNGDGKTDQALFRPSTNQWFFNPALLGGGHLRGGQRRPGPGRLQR